MNTTATTFFSSHLARFMSQLMSTHFHFHLNLLNEGLQCSDLHLSNDGHLGTQILDTSKEVHGHIDAGGKLAQHLGTELFFLQPLEQWTRHSLQLSQLPLVGLVRE